MLSYSGKITVSVPIININTNDTAKASKNFYYLAPATTQKIPLTSGWNMISFNIVPENDTTPVVFGTSSSGLVIAKNNSGRAYWPSLGIDDLGHEQVGQGYKVLTNSLDTLKVQGVPVVYANTPISLNSGWNMIAYLPPTKDSIEHALYNIEGSMVMVKNDSGHVFWPSHGIDDIVFMLVGQGYQIYATASGSLTYPAPGALID